MQFTRPITLGSIEAVPIRAKGGVSPKMALGTMSTRPALLVRVEDTAGCFGWGEIWANFPPRANLHKAHIIEDVIASHLAGLTFCDPREAGEALRAKLSVFFLHVGQCAVFEHILAGLDTALWDLALRSADHSFADFMGLNTSRARSYATSINAEDLERLIPHHAKLGQSHFKLKIGFADHGNTRIVEQAVALCPQSARIMVDSNQSWSLSGAKSFLQTIEAYAPYFAEEPLRADAPDADWEALAKSTDIPLAGGENIYGIDNFLRKASLGLQFLQPDVAKWGGMSGALDLAKQVPDGVSIWPHFMGTSVGQVAALSVSAAIGDTSSCEVDVNENALRTELSGDVLAIENGLISLPAGPGLVVPPTREALAAFSEKAV